MTFEKLVRLYRFYEALALYDAYFERMANLGEKGAHLGNALPIAWVPLVFHCTYFDRLQSILRDGEIRPGEGRDYVALTEISVTELARFRSLRPKPFDIAIGFPRAQLEGKGLFQPAYLKHAGPEVKARFTDLSPGYVELDDDLGALHEVRVPSSLRIDDAVWVLSSRLHPETQKPNLSELKPVEDLGIAVSFWDPSHQEGMIREPVFRKVKKDGQGNLESLRSVGKHYLPEWDHHIDKLVTLPAGEPFLLRFPKELREENLKNGWKGPFSKYEMAAYCFAELNRNFPGQMDEVRPRIQF